VTRSHAGADERRFARIKGTAWRCMLEPIKARLASSFSRNGIKLAATETSSFGETSTLVDFHRDASQNFPAWRQLTSSVVIFRTVVE